MEETIKVGLFTEEIRIPWRELFSALILVIGVIGLYKCAADMETGLYATDMNTQSAVISLPVSDAKVKPGRDILDLTDAVTWNLPEIAKTEKEIALPVTEEVTAQAADTDVIAAAVLHVTGYANGGLPEIVEYTGDFSDFSSDDLAVPSRLGKLFDGWYEDEACTRPFSGVAEGVQELRLYAGWREIPDFVCNDEGYITKCTGELVDGILLLPIYTECKGIISGALDGRESEVLEICIPNNITYIDPGVFDGLENLVYIEVMSGNPVYDSMFGSIYDKNGNLIFNPNE